MANVSINAVYRELKSLRKEIHTVKCALIPEEKISAKELREIRKIKKDMEAGEETSFEDAFSC